MHDIYVDWGKHVLDENLRHRELSNLILAYKAKKEAQNEDDMKKAWELAQKALHNISRPLTRTRAEAIEYAKKAAGEFLGWSPHQ